MKSYNDGIEFAINVVKAFIQDKPSYGMFTGINSKQDDTLKFIIKELRKEQENGRNEERSWRTTN